MLQFQVMIFIMQGFSNRVTHNVGQLCAGGEIVFRLPVTEIQFIDKSSLFILLPNDIHHAETDADACTELMIKRRATFAQNSML
jgi:hypothetical protein